MLEKYAFLALIGIQYGLDTYWLSLRKNRVLISSSEKFVDKKFVGIVVFVVTINILTYLLWWRSVKWGTMGDPMGLLLFGSLIFIVGYTLRYISIRQLGDWFVPQVAIEINQPLVERGLYRFVRHPSYTGMILAYIGIGIASNSYPFLVLLVLSTSAVLYLRTIREERFLTRTVPGYRNYRNRTGRFLPKFTKW